MPYAKEPLYVGDLLIADTGRYVNANAVDRYGWHDKVTDEPEEQRSEPAPARTRRRKGA